MGEHVAPGHAEDRDIIKWGKDLIRQVSGDAYIDGITNLRTLKAALELLTANSQVQKERDSIQGFIDFHDLASIQ
ncbi:MAG: hypothetical protein ABIR91_03925 [Candidatus Saccharimonadales bacterium]